MVLVGHPFDTTKTRLQVAPAGQYRSTIDCVKQTLSRQGLKGFYTGIYSPLAGQMVFRATSFGTYFYAVKHFSKEHETPPLPTLFAAGAVTGLAISFVEAPIDLVKTKLQIKIFESSNSSSLTGSSSPTLRQCIHGIVRMHGPLAFWQGWTATAVRNIPVTS